MAPKDKLDKFAVSGAIYRIPCADCGASYIGESGRPLSTRLKEHKKAVAELSKHHSGVAEHVVDTGHEIDWEAVSILDKEPWQQQRKILEAIHIRRERPSMNRDQGYELTPIFDPLFPPVTTRAATSAPYGGGGPAAGSQYGCG